MNTKTTVISSTISNIQNWTNFCKLFTHVAAEADQKKKGSLTPTQPTNPTLIFFVKLFFQIFNDACHFCRCVFNASFCHSYFNLKFYSLQRQVGSLLGQHLYKLGSWQSWGSNPGKGEIICEARIANRLISSVTRVLIKSSY